MLMPELHSLNENHLNNYHHYLSSASLAPVRLDSISTFDRSNSSNESNISCVPSRLPSIQAEFQACVKEEPDNDLIDCKFEHKCLDLTLIKRQQQQVNFESSIAVSDIDLKPTSAELLLSASTHQLGAFTDNSNYFGDSTATVSTPFSASPPTTTGISRRKLHQCDACPSQFGSKMELEEHQNSHTGEKPFECDVCSSRFNRRSTLWNHKRIHNDTKPFTCPVCQMQFKWKNSLKCHKDMHIRKNETGDMDMETFELKMAEAGAGTGRSKTASNGNPRRRSAGAAVGPNPAKGRRGKKKADSSVIDGVVDEVARTFGDYSPLNSFGGSGTPSKNISPHHLVGVSGGSTNNNDARTRDANSGSVIQSHPHVNHTNLGSILQAALQSADSPPAGSSGGGHHLNTHNLLLQQNINYHIPSQSMHLAGQSIGLPSMSDSVSAVATHHLIPHYTVNYPSVYTPSSVYGQQTSVILASPVAAALQGPQVLSDIGSASSGVSSRIQHTTTHQGADGAGIARPQPTAYSSGHGSSVIQSVHYANSHSSPQSTQPASQSYSLVSASQRPTGGTSVSHYPHSLLSTMSNLPTSATVGSSTLSGLVNGYPGNYAGVINHPQRIAYLPQAGDVGVAAAAMAAAAGGQAHAYGAYGAASNFDYTPNVDIVSSLQHPFMVAAAATAAPPAAHASHLGGTVTATSSASQQQAYLGYLVPTKEVPFEQW